jgi:thymidylate kinase
MKKGILIAIEGPDCCGKSTLVERLINIISSMTDREALCTHFPIGCYPKFHYIKEMLQDPKADSNDLQNLMLDNISEGLAIVEDYLKEGKIVILDRWILSNIIYSFKDNAQDHIDFLASCSNMFIPHYMSADESVERRKVKLIDTFDIHKTIYNKKCSMDMLPDLYPDLVLVINPSKEIVLKNAKSEGRKDNIDLNDTDESRLIDSIDLFEELYMSRVSVNGFLGKYTIKVPNSEFIHLPSFDLDKEDEYWNALYVNAIYEVGKIIKLNK